MTRVTHRVQASIARSALAHNFNVARQAATGYPLAVIIKANAYGHGLLPVAEALAAAAGSGKVAAADVFGVTDIDEAEALRAAGFDRNILILQGLIDRSDIARIAAQGFQVVIHRSEHLQWLEEELAKVKIPVPLTFWLKLDSGMGRLGIAPEDYSRAFLALSAKPWTARVVMMTHLASASDPEADLNTRQLACFSATKEKLENLQPTHTTFHKHDLALPPGLTLTRSVEITPGIAASIAASAGLLALKCPSNMPRPGIMLYGSSPFAWTDTTRRREAFGLQAVMTLQARLISVTEHQAGASIGYNSQFICPRPMRIGIVSCGYADGYPSNTRNGAPVAIRGQRSTTVGRVSMDMLAMDLTQLPDVQCGELVTLWGKEVSVDEVAAHTGILSYNLLCSVAARVPRVYV